MLRAVMSQKKEYRIPKPLIRSAWSIGANIRETKYAGGSLDFMPQYPIALKEAHETAYWLEIMLGSELKSKGKFEDAVDQDKEIIRLRISSINTLKRSSPRVIMSASTCTPINAYDEM